MTMGGPMTLKSSKIKRFNGTLETYNYLWVLTRNPAIETLYIPANDWEVLTESEKIELDPRGVVINVFKNADKTLPKKDRLYDVMKDLKVDFAIVKAEYGWGRVNIKETIWKNETETYSPLSMQQNYSAHALVYLNKTKVPYILLAVDPRLLHERLLVRMDTIHVPIEISAQINYDLKIKHIARYVDEYSDQEFIESPVPVRYRCLEPMNSIHYYKNTIPKDKPIRLTLGTMQDVTTNVKKSRRFELIEKWILKYDTNKEVQIFGRWDDYYLEQYDQMKGLIDYKALDDIMLKTRYTYVIGIGSDWSTSKWADSLACGVIPFIAPDYDTQYNAIPKDHYIRVETPEELNEKMDYLDVHPEEREKLLQTLYDTLFKDVKDGVFLYKHINDAIEPLKLQLSLVQDNNIKRKRQIKQLF